MNLEELEKQNNSYQKKDSEKLNLLLQIITACSTSNPAKCIIYCKQAIDLAEYINDEGLSAKSFSLISTFYKNTGEYTEAERLLEKAISINKSSENESGLAFNLLELGDIMRAKSEFYESKKFLDESLTLYQKLNDEGGISRVYSLLGNVYLGLSDFSESKEYFHKAIKIQERNGNFSRMAGTLSNLGIVYSMTGDYPQALEQFQKAFSLNEKSEKRIWMTANLGNIGNIYFELQDFDKALENFKKSANISRLIDDKYGLANSISNMGSAYFELSDYEKAMECFQESLWISKEISNKLSVANGLLCIGKIKFIKSRSKEALENFQEALKISEEIGNKETEVLAYTYMAEWLLNTPDNFQQELGFDPSKKYIIAEEYLLKSLKISEEQDIKRQENESHKLLSELYERNGLFEKSLNSYKKHIEVRDAIQGEESKKQVTRKEMQYEFDKKEALSKAEQEKKDAVALKELQRQKLLRNSFIGGFTTVLAFAGVFFKQRNSIRKGKKLSDELLLNILPEEVADELKAKGSADAKQFNEVTVMFTDFKGFTKISEKLSPSELVAEIDTCFKAFDRIISKYNIEKIKTIGDSYMCAGGLPVENTTNAVDVVKAALEIQEFMKEHLSARKQSGREIFEIRTGIHTGPVVAGIVGVKKFAYDIWGNTVNIASRMESSGEAGKVNISSTTYELVKNNFNCLYRGKVEAKNIGEMDMYFVEA